MHTMNDLKELMPHLVAAAQEQYDAWEQDEEGCDPELGSGGICHLIADEMCSVLASAGIDCSSTHSEGVGENHVWVTAVVREGVVTIDIPPHVYEIGSGYVWKKIPGVSITADHVHVDVIDRDPSNFRDYVSEGFDFDDTEAFAP